MAMIADVVTLAFVSVGVVFFIAGTLGILRFPDALTRLHAVTKADNLGLGLIVIGVVPQTGSVWLASKLLLVWMLNNLAAATIAQLLARVALTAGPEIARSEE